ncbi:SRPBCC family protein [Pelomonas sp. KK5]|uniref:SRPBCC family protein n=1 Tax=Pelomonas sp. KK5 TaxID=1855730 RepID=UPI00097CA4CE|nr:SRPBCC family protein [Pelomonas sp. KK5]
MSQSRFVYVSYIRTTPEKLWQSLTDASFIKQFWFGMNVECEWKPGASWALRFQDGRLADSGEIVEFDPPRRLAIRWTNQWKPEFSAEGPSLCVMEIEPHPSGAVKLTITHSMDKADSGLIGAVGGGWPLIISNLKSLLETGTVAVPEK